MLLGGRMADLLGRRRVLMAALAVGLVLIPVVGWLASVTASA